MQKLLPSPQQIGILLLAFGGPNSLDEVEPFLKNIFSGRPLNPSLFNEVRERYRLIGGRSPLPEITERQARALKDSLKKAGVTIEVYIGMRYWHPFIQESLKAMSEKGVSKILCLILSPFASRAFAGGYIDAVNQAIKNADKEMEADFVTNWHLNPLYLDAVSEKVNEGLARFPLNQRLSVQIIFTSHSLPLSLVKNDPYVEQIKETISGVMECLGHNEWHLAFQSRGRGEGEWLSPDVEEVLKILAGSEKKEILVVPLGFVSDHLETLYDLDISLREKASALGICFQRSPSLNDSPEFIEALTNIILKFLYQQLT